MAAYAAVGIVLAIVGYRGRQGEHRQMIKHNRVPANKHWEQEHTAVESARMGVVDYLPKPFTPNELRKATGQALRLAADPPSQAPGRFRPGVNFPPRGSSGHRHHHHCNGPQSGPVATSLSPADGPQTLFYYGHNLIIFESPHSRYMNSVDKPKRIM